MARSTRAAVLAALFALSAATSIVAQPRHGGHHWGGGYRGGGYRGGHHRHHGNAGAFVAAGIGGLVLGAALASANRYDPPPAPLPYNSVDTYIEPYGGHDWARYCAAKFSTYNPATGQYLAADGRTYPCH